MKRSLIPFLEFLKILDDPEVNSAGRLNRYFSWGEDTKPVERGMLIGIGLQLINSYIFFDESHKFSKNSLQKVDNIIGHLISTFPKKYSKWRKMSPEISRVSENLSEYSSKEEFISEIAWIFAGKLFKLKRQEFNSLAFIFLFEKKTIEEFQDLFILLDYVLL